MRSSRQSGLSFIELLVVLALMSTLALVALPFVHHRYRLMQELELKRNLAMMRGAIDRFHELAMLGQIEPWDLDWMMYPEDLEMLVEGVEVKAAADQDPVLVRFLREIPVDPITGEAEWDCRAYDDDPDDFSSRCDNLYDVASTSTRLALDGTYYNEW
ncbi:MAG: type II secretion system protein [Acidobacteriota bacterium]|nr:type II secretion system protein [Acidobacteriota bacterium]MDQ7088930.1 type II secretion system protein [Acidobacteriota bacterium]